MSNKELQTGLPIGSLHYLQPHPTVDGYIFLHYKDGEEKWGKKGGINPKVRAANKKWRQTSRGRQLRREEVARHYRKNKEIHYARGKKRSSRQKKFKLSPQNKKIMADLSLLRDELNLSAMGAGALESFELDHIIEINGRGRTGLHVPWNIQLLTREENRKKSNNPDHVVTGPCFEFTLEWLSKNYPEFEK